MNLEKFRLQEIFPIIVRFFSFAFSEWSMPTPRIIIECIGLSAHAV